MEQQPPPTLDAINAFPVESYDDGAPEVLAHIVDDMDDRGDDGDDDDAGGGMESVETPGASGATYIPPQLPVILPNNSQGFYVRLTLSVGAGGATIAPGLEIDDCGQCPFCLDKPKYGGPGTKRQKCELKQQEASLTADNREARIWSKLHLITAQERTQMIEIAKLPLPEPLTKAIEIGPLPLVWAYRRKRRARTLPPAYVLMYYCEDRVPLDRTQLAISRQRYFKNSRPDLATDANGRSKPRKTRVQRPRFQPPEAPVYMHGVPGDMTTYAPPHYDVTGAGYAQPYGQPGDGMCPVVYGQPVPGTAPTMYAAPPPPGQMYAQPPPGQMYAQPPPPMYAQQPLYAPPGPSQPVMYPPPPNAMSPEMPGARRSRKGRGAADVPPPPAAAHPDYYAAHADPYAYAGPTAPVSHMDMGAQPPPAHMGQMEDEANSWIADPNAPGSDPADYNRSKRTKRGSSPRSSVSPPAPVPAPPPPADDDSSSMSNKTLDLMLSRLQGQLPPATYEKVITLVRDVQCRRMSLSRSEFLQHFQAICAESAKK